MSYILSASSTASGGVFVVGLVMAERSEVAQIYLIPTTVYTMVDSLVKNGKNGFELMKPSFGDLYQKSNNHAV